jgi:hypothetical protein
MCSLVKLGTPATMRVARPSPRNWGSIECGNGFPSLLVTGPAGRVRSIVAISPIRANSGRENDSNHSSVSGGGHEVKNRPTCPCKRWTLGVVSVEWRLSAKA